MSSSRIELEDHRGELRQPVHALAESQRGKPHRLGGQRFLITSKRQTSFHANILTAIGRNRMQATENCLICAVKRKRADGRDFSCAYNHPQTHALRLGRNLRQSLIKININPTLGQSKFKPSHTLAGDFRSIEFEVVKALQ